MLSHPTLLLAQVYDHQRQMIAEAQRSRVLGTALRRRRARHAAKRHAEQAVGKPSEGTLAGCGERAPAPAQ